MSNNRKATLKGLEDLKVLVEEVPAHDDTQEVNLIQQLFGDIEEVLLQKAEALEIKQEAYDLKKKAAANMQAVKGYANRLKDLKAKRDAAEIPWEKAKDEMRKELYGMTVTLGGGKFEISAGDALVQLKPNQAMYQKMANRLNDAAVKKAAELNPTVWDEFETREAEYLALDAEVSNLVAEADEWGKSAEQKFAKANAMLRAIGMEVKE